MIKLNPQEIILTLDRLGIKREQTAKKGWLSILCPLPTHGKPDKQFGNCAVNLSSGAISCFACKGSGHISTLAKNANIVYT